VLDLGCGSGATTAKLRDAVAPHGSVVGVDISPDQIEVARRRVRGGVRFEVADAQTFPFERNGFDALFSRFGCMFFDDPDAAFGNLSGALRPKGRAVLVVWREIGLNPWAALRAGVGAELFALRSRRHRERRARSAGRLPPSSSRSFGTRASATLRGPKST
jgi:ubiquinone/menaquinone biosynthesis C-methylase UbiE